MWMEFAQAGIKGFSAFYGASLQNQYTAIDNMAARATARNSNRVRLGSNVLSAAIGDAQRAEQSRRNAATLEAGGLALEELAVNSARMQDDLLAQGIEASLQHAEALGAQAATAAAYGASGSVVDDVNVATSLRFARAARAAESVRDTAAYDSSRRAALIADQAISGTDVSNVFSRVDYGRDVAVQKQETNPWGAALIAVAGSLAKSAGAGAFDDMLKKGTETAPWSAFSTGFGGMPATDPFAPSPFSTAPSYLDGFKL